MNRPLAIAPSLRRSRLWLHVLLFFATCATTWLAGAVGHDLRSAVIAGLQYMASIMSILLAHEMGHFVAARLRQVPASLPYFIPLPLPPVGTFGAVISMRGRIRTRDALMEVGAAGPLCGLVVAIPLLWVGLKLSTVGPMPAEGLLEGNSLLYWTVKRLALGPIPAGQDVLLHPMAWAGWVGLLVTAINLLPIGQLDGGHILYALWKKRHGLVSRLFHFGLFFFGAAVFAGNWLSARAQHLDWEAAFVQAAPGINWMMLAGLLLLFDRLNRGKLLEHPATDDEILSLRHRLVGLFCVLVLVLTFTPVPLRVLG